MKIKNHPPSGESFVWLTRELLSSDAWRSQSIHTRRLIDFLLLEYLRRAGQTNGQLKAPYRQLYAFGVGAHFAPAAIDRRTQSNNTQCWQQVNRTGFIGGPIPREDGPDGTTQQICPRAA